MISMFDRLRTRSQRTHCNCSFFGQVLGSKEMGFNSSNSLESAPSVPGRVAQWLQSAAAEVWIKFLLALLGLALVAADGFEGKAAELAHSALAADPKLLKRP